MTNQPEQHTARPELSRTVLPRNAIATVACAVAAVAACIGLALAGSRPTAAPEGLPDAGAVTGWSLPATTAIAWLIGALTLGLLIVPVLALGTRTAPDSTAVIARSGRAASVVAVVWMIVLGIQTLLAASLAFGIPPSRMDGAVVSSFVQQTAQGRALCIQLLGAFVIALVAWTITSRTQAAVAASGALLVLLPPALTGHASSAANHDTAVTALAIHIAGYTLWAGGLMALVIIGTALPNILPTAVPRFSSLALWAFAATAISGLINASLRLASPLELFTTGYGRTVVIKIVLTAVVVGLGWWHRRHSMRTLAAAPASWSFLRLAGAEVLLFAATIGVGAALSNSAPPVSGATDLSEASAARVVLGFDLPPAPTGVRVLTETRADLLWLALSILLGALYLRAIVTLARRGDRWPLGRTVSFGIGLLLILAATSAGIGVYAPVLFSAHMVQHMVLSTLAPIFLVLGAPLTLALRALPTSPSDPGPREWLVALLHSRPLKFIAHPLIAAAIFTASFFGLYFTALLPTLMGSHWGHVLMQVHFLLAGYLFFWTLIGIDPGPRRLPYPLRILVLLGVMSIHAFFNIAILQSTTVLAEPYFVSLQRPYLLDLLADQRTGASVGWAMGELPLLVVMLVLAVQWARSEDREAARSDRRSEVARAKGDTDELDDYNTMLAALEEREQLRRSGQRDPA